MSKYNHWTPENIDFRNRGIDSDLKYALECNPQELFNVHDIKKVYAVWEGENDGDDWRWLVEFNEPIQINPPYTATRKYAYIIGGCDYTGWD